MKLITVISIVILDQSAGLPPPISKEVVRMYICLCKGITESDVKECGRNGFITPQVLACRLGINAEDCCGRCLRNVEEIVALACNEHADAAHESNSRSHLHLRQ
jgi:bacterioferritin-associated ferredoxin